MAFKRRLFLGNNAPPAAAVHLRPVADGTIGSGWTPVGAATVWQALADDLDTTYAQIVGSDTFTVKLQGVTDPQSSNGHVLKFRGLRSTVPATFQIQLWIGDPDGIGSSTFIAANTFSLTASAADYTYALIGAEADAVTEAAYNGNLYVKGISHT